MLSILAGAVLFTVAACEHSADMRAERPAPVTKLQLAKIIALKEEHNASAIGIGLNENGELIWADYFGEQAPGVPVSAATMFNTASVTKAVITETFLRLAERGLVTLDEPSSPFSSTRISAKILVIGG